MRILIVLMLGLASVSVSHAEDEYKREFLSRLVLICDLSGTEEWTDWAASYTKEETFYGTATVKIEKVRHTYLSSGETFINYFGRIGEEGNPFMANTISSESPISETEYSFKSGDGIKSAESLVINRLTGSLDFYDLSTFENLRRERSFFGSCEIKTKQKF